MLKTNLARGGSGAPNVRFGFGIPHCDPAIRFRESRAFREPRRRSSPQADEPADGALRTSATARVKQVLCLAQFLFVFAWPLACPGQHAGHQMELPLFVDGAKTPELIPEELAQQHFLLALSVPASPSLTEVKRQEAQLESLGLEDGEKMVLRREVQLFRQEWEQLDRKWGAAMRPGAAEAQARAAGELRMARSQLCASTMARLRSLLAQESAGRLERYVRERVRTRIKIYGSAN